MFSQNSFKLLISNVKTYPYILWIKNVKIKGLTIVIHNINITYYYN